MNILYVTPDANVPTTSATFVRDRLVAQGHTVTFITQSLGDYGNLSVYDLILIGQSVTSSNASKVDAATCGVLSLGGACLPHSKMTSVAVSSGGASTQLNITTSAGDPIFGNATGVTTFLTSSTTNLRFVDNVANPAAFPASVAILATGAGNTARKAAWRCEAGATLHDGIVTPSRRTFISFMQIENANATGLAWLDSAVTWTANLPAQPPTANAGPDQAVEYGNLVTLTGSGSDTDGTITGYQWTQVAGAAVTLSSATAAAPTFTAPEVVGGDTLVFELVVTDDTAMTSNPDTVSITVTSPAYMLYMKPDGEVVPCRLTVA